MITRRLVINLVAFFLLSFVLVGYGVFDLLGNPFKDTTTVSAVFPDASGVYPNFLVELNGVDVGTVKSVVLTHDGARIVMSINPGTSVPGDVVAAIDVANDLGEQVVELTPTHGGHGKPLVSGAVIPIAKVNVPANVGEVVATATKLLQAIPPGDLNSLLGDLATALKGRAADLRSITNASATFSKEFLGYQKQFQQLLVNAPPVLNSVSAVGPQLQQALINTESLVQVLANRRYDLDTLLQQGSTATGQLANLVTTQSANLGCLFHDLSQVVANVSQTTNLTNLSQSLADNQYFFGAVNKTAITGDAIGLRSGEPTNPNQLFLRTRLLLPPALPGPIAYPTENQLPSIEPGAGCNNEFGQGVGPATQANFVPAAGGTVVQPTAAESQVNGGGDTSTPLLRTTASSFKSAGAADPLPTLLPLGGLFVPALLLGWAARPSRRRARRRG